MVVPYPFTKAAFIYGPPIHVPRDGDVETWRRGVETTLNELAARAEKHFEGDR